MPMHATRKFADGDAVRLLLTCWANPCVVDGRHKKALRPVRLVRLTMGTRFTVVRRDTPCLKLANDPAYCCRDAAGKRWRIAESLLELAPVEAVGQTEPNSGSVS